MLKQYYYLPEKLLHRMGQDFSAIQYIFLPAPEPEPHCDVDRLTSTTVVLMSLLSLFLIPQITAYFRAFMQSREPNLELNK